MRSDLIQAVEACYDLSLALEPWLAAVAQALHPLMDRGHGVGAWTYAPGAWTTGNRPIGLANELGERMFATPAHFTADELARAYLGARVGTLRERLGYSEDRIRKHPAFSLHQGAGIEDFLGLTVSDAAGRGALVVAPQSTTAGTPAPLMRRLERIGAHLHAALRLRSALEQLDDAVLDPEGRALHAEGHAKPLETRERLRNAVVAISRARSRAGRQNGDEALSTWQALVAGRWSIVERFDTDGRRFLLARRNVPGAGPAAPMPPIEQHALLLRAQGLALKVIAYELGVSQALVSRAIASGLKRLGLQSETELFPLFLAQAEGAVAGFRQT
jgi:hypothetical protein